MRVHDALGMSRRARRVAHRRSGEFVIQIGERLRFARRDQRVVVERALGSDAIVRDDDDMLEWRARGELLERWPEHLVHDGDFVPRIGGDVGEIVGVQAQVQRVQHEPRCRRAEVHLEVPVVIPREGRDAVALLCTEPAQRGPELSRASQAIAVGVPEQRAVSAPTHDFSPAMQTLGMAQQSGQRQGRIHHETAQW